MTKPTVSKQIAKISGGDKGLSSCKCVICHNCYKTFSPVRSKFFLPVSVHMSVCPRKG